MFRINKPLRTFLSMTTVEDTTGNAQTLYTSEFLNTLNPNDLPPHELNLKVGSIVMLLRNIGTRSGMCNGTRLRIKSFDSNSIQAEILTGI
jgi:hypothetical protein